MAPQLENIKLGGPPKQKQPITEFMLIAAGSLIHSGSAPKTCGNVSACESRKKTKGRTFKEKPRAVTGISGLYFSGSKKNQIKAAAN
jgi:hypothetical protein